MSSFILWPRSFRKVFVKFKSLSVLNRKLRGIAEINRSSMHEFLSRSRATVQWCPHNKCVCGFCALECKEIFSQKSRNSNRIYYYHNSFLVDSQWNAWLSNDLELIKRSSELIFYLFQPDSKQAWLIEEDDIGLIMQDLLHNWKRTSNNHGPDLERAILLESRLSGHTHAWRWGVQKKRKRKEIKRTLQETEGQRIKLTLSWVIKSKSWNSVADPVLQLKGGPVLLCLPCRHFFLLWIFLLHPK